MRKLLRAAAVSAVAAPLLLLGAGAASADDSSYCNVRTSANANGAWTHSRCSHASTDDHRHGDYDRHGYRHGGLLSGLGWLL